MIKYLAKAKEAIPAFRSIQLTQVPREENGHVDALAKLASTLKIDLPKSVVIEVAPYVIIDILDQPVQEIEDKPCWIDLLLAYLSSGTLILDQSEARCIQSQVAWHCIINDSLYQRFFSGPCMRCIRPRRGKVSAQGDT